MVREGKSRGMTIVRGHDTAAHTDTNSRQKRRNYVDFGTTRGSEAAVEKWLSETDVPTTRRPPTSTDPPRVRSQSVSGRFTSSNPSLLKRMSSYKRGSSSGPMFRETDSSRSALFSRGDATSYEKGHLKEKFRSKLNLMRSPSASKSQSISSHRKRESFEPPGEKSDEQRTDDGCTPSRPGQDERSSTDPCVSTLSCLSINAQNSVDIASMVVQHDEVKNASSPVPGSVRSNTDTSTLKQCTKNGETTPSPAVDEEYRIDTQSSVFMEKEAARSLGPLFHSDRDSQSERDSPPASVAATSNVSLKSKRAVDDCLSTSSPPLKDTYDLITKALAEPINDTSSKPVEDLSSPAAPVNDPIGTPVVAPASATASTPSSASTAASTKSFPKEKLHGPFISNRIKLHIYDLISSDTTYELPLGVTLPIGTYFSVLNDGLHRIGSGAYHVGVEVNGVEYAYGANSVKGTTGVFTCKPKKSPIYQYRKSIDFGERTMTRDVCINSRGQQVGTVPGTDGFPAGCYEARIHVDGRDIMKEMTQEYLGFDYDLLRKNCCTFAYDACLRLGIDESTIPRWFLTLADAGAYTQDLALSATRPISSALSKIPCKCNVAVPNFFSQRGLEMIKDCYQEDASLRILDVETRSENGESQPAALINDNPFR